MQISLLLQVAAIAQLLFIARFHRSLEQIQMLRYGNHVDAVTFSVAGAIILALVGFIGGLRFYKRKFWALALVLIFIGVGAIVPALIPAQAQ